jgi:hypothetical protein
MSHFVVLVVGDDIEEQLAPYDENLTVEPYVEAPSTDPEYGWQRTLERAKEYYAEHAPDEDRSHWTDQRYLNQFSGEGWKPAQEGEGFEKWTTYNPKSKWDWYVEGGRWEGFIKTTDGMEVDSTTLAAVDITTLNIPFAIVKDGEWQERGKMGWFGMVRDEAPEAEWEQQVRANLMLLPKTTKITVVDCHI